MSNPTFGANDPDRPPDADIGRVLRAAGRRVEPPEDLMREVRAAVQSEWQAFTLERRRMRRRRFVSLAAAAGIAAVAVFVALNLFVQPERAVMANVTATVGDVFSSGGFFARHKTLAAGRQLPAGNEIVTGPGAGAAIELKSGIAVRLDSGTRIQLAEGRLVLESGAVYVDAGPGSATTAARDLLVETPVGTVRHLGTQYEVRLADKAMQVTVREGRVETSAAALGSHVSEAGERLVLTADGKVERRRVPAYAEDWQWTTRAAPAYVMEGRTLAQFLQWVGREMGRPIVFATPEGEAEALRTVLRGDLGELPPERALSAVLSTTRLDSIQQGEKILIKFR